MTPEEAIKIAIHCFGVQAEQEVCEECPVYLESGIACREVARVAISALKEIQQYREIGTVEQVKNQKENLNVAYQIISDYEQYGTIEDFKKAQRYMRLVKAHGTIGRVIDSCAEYEEIGTVEECREAVEKQKPEKPEIYTDTIQTISTSFNRDVYLCSRCGQFIGNIDDELPRYCNCCGQRIDEDLEGMEDE